MTKRTLLISGGVRGIGLAISLAFAKRGYNIATFSRTQNEIDAFRGRIEELGTSCLAEVGDACDDVFLQTFVVSVAERFGGIFALVNNAGGGKKDSVLNASLADWDQTLAVNLRAAMVLTKFALPEIVKTPGALIVNIASIAGKIGMADSSSYSAAKFGLIGFTEALFEEVREYGVKVSAICPGYVDTPLIPSRKALMREEMIRPEDIARAVEFVLDSSPSACPVEITIRPQKSPFRK
jgi:NAD(P)-dependent dehydrogenase (short-subunit alcohol dehydrogenase family)